MQLRGQKCAGAARGYRRFPSGKQPPSPLAFGLGRVLEGVGSVLGRFVLVVFFFFLVKSGGLVAVPRRSYNCSRELAGMLLWKV